MRIGVGMCLVLLACKGNAAGTGGTVASSSFDASADALGGFTFGSHGYGPDPAPRSCDGDASSTFTQCGTPAPVCIDAGLLVEYSFPTCASGGCVWEKQNFNCPGEGSICIGDTDANLPPSAEGGTWARSGPCAVPVDASVVPTVPCDEDAGNAVSDAAGDAAAACPPPPSVCHGLNSILYFDDGVCLSRQCSWTPRLQPCLGGACSMGACVYLGTSAPAFPN